MPHAGPHPLALFSLLPLNERSQAVLDHPYNKHLVSRQKDGRLALDIGHVRSMLGDPTLATLGRNGDIYVEGSSFSRNQCSFEINPYTKVVMFYDRSHSQTSQVFGQDNAFPLEPGRPRKVLVRQGLNIYIGMGGVARDLIQFQLIWHNGGLTETIELVKGREAITLEEHLRFSRTLDESITASSTQRQTRVHTPGARQLKMRHVKENTLGSGEFGEVYKAIDVDTGMFMAVKVLKPREATPEDMQSFYKRVKGEVEKLSRIDNASKTSLKLLFVGLDDCTSQEFKIFMGLKEGNLTTLIEGGCSTDIDNLCITVLRHMLRALGYLESQRIIYRDVKPDNILYVTRQNKQYHFLLGDFGLRNNADMAKTFAGTPPYMAPEILTGFREASKRFRSPKDAQNAVLHVASNEEKVAVISEMATVDPEKRSSAAAMLLKCFGEKGLTSQHDQVSYAKNSPVLTCHTTDTYY
ncbi:kinase-like protein [Daldinia decipiens]|uniref:kinase-like protein n=1 Tax=Daldinia decipiens TaxID=326647 RepID=UPI0020C324FF|nr:kinase-like protein [Daldinia decipiens]KAI1655128.1 kinase-like protein [Daldinia decipiens]